ncbi:MAG TPA: class I SAM-dependent methyltransferase [Pyrinomonadaceae bacterium]|jgi:SAM-dependent methyltransferase
MMYEAENGPVLARVPSTSRRILDVGCGSGALGRKIKIERNCEVIGITYSEAEAVLARNHLDDVVVCDLNSFTPNGLLSFDCIVCSHVLEHIADPENLLKALLSLLSPDGTLLVALPNVLFWHQRWEFMRGRFKYTDGGLMDRTHYRFFDWVAARELLINSGYEIVEAAADGGFPLSRFLFRAGRWLDRVSVKVFPGLFGFQFIFVCTVANNRPKFIS